MKPIRPKRGVSIARGSHYSGLTTVIFAAVFLCLWVPQTCLAGVQIDRAYRHKIWQLEDGLPQNSVQVVLQTRDGYIWVGTTKGLARFDGVNFTVFDASSSVTALWEGRDGALWIGTDGQGLLRLQAGKFEHFGKGQGLPGDFVRVLYGARNGVLYVGCRDGLARFENGKFEPCKFEQWESGVFIRAMCEDPQGHLWLGTTKYLIQEKDGVFGAPVSNLPGNIRGLLCDRTGTFWFGSAEGLVKIQNGQRLATYTMADGLAANLVSTLFEDSRGNLWIGTYGGLNRMCGGKMLTELNSEGVSYDQITCIMEDREGNIWAGSKEGLSRLTLKSFESYTTQSGLSQNNVMAVCEDKSGAVWATTWGGGLNQIANGECRVFDHPGMPTVLKNALLLAICEDHGGGLWIGTDWGAGLVYYKQGMFTHYLSGEGGLDKTAIKVIYEDRHGRIWVGTSTSLQVLENGSFKRFTEGDGLAGNQIRAITEDSSGRLWIGTDRGLSRKEENGFTNFRKNEGLADDSVYAIYEDRDHTMWVGTDGGLNRSTGDVFKHYTSREGLSADQVLEILEDDIGNLWMATKKGIIRVARKSLDEFDRGVIDRPTFLNYGKPDGMENAQCNGVAKPAGCKTRDGRLWFATVKGLLSIDPKDDLKDTRMAPTLLVEKIVADKKHVVTSEHWKDAGPGQNSTVRQVVVLPSGRGNLEFHYTGLSYLAPERNVFRYRLEGHDENWIDAGTRRVAYYSNLRPGRYTFRVIGCNCDGVWNQKGDLVECYLEPHFYQTDTFQLLCGLSVCFGILGAHRLRLRRLQTRQKELVELVDERTRNVQAANEKLETTNKKLEAEILERRRAEEALRLSRERVSAQERLAVVGQLAAGVAHEFNNVLTVIQGHADLLLEEDHSPETVDSLKSISAGAARAANLTGQMLAFGRRQLMRPQKIELNELFEKLTKTIGPLLTERIALRFRREPNLPLLHADPGMIEQIVLNLAVNARDAMPTGGTLDMNTGYIELTGSDLERRRLSTFGSADAYPGRFVWFSMVDSGCGMDPGTLKRIFEPFFTTKGVGKGTGLGLATVYGIVKQHNGWIEVDSEIGKGTNFQVFLPVSAPEVQPLRAAKFEAR